MPLSKPYAACWGFNVVTCLSLYSQPAVPRVHQLASHHVCKLLDAAGLSAGEGHQLSGSVYLTACKGTAVALPPRPHAPPLVRSALHLASRACILLGACFAGGTACGQFCLFIALLQLCSCFGQQLLRLQGCWLNLLRVLDTKAGRLE